MFSTSAKQQQTGKSLAARLGLGAPSILGADSRIRGDLVTESEIQFDGKIEGNLSGAAIVIGEHATVTGHVRGENIVVRGVVHGSLRGRNVRLEKSAKLVGDVWHETLHIEAGAFIEGRCVHTDNPMEAIPTNGAAAGSEVGGDMAV